MKIELPTTRLQIVTSASFWNRRALRYAVWGLPEQAERCRRESAKAMALLRGANGR